jgi:hypothetical protein
LRAIRSRVFSKRGVIVRFCLSIERSGGGACLPLFPFGTIISCASGKLFYGGIDKSAACCYNFSQQTDLRRRTYTRCSRVPVRTLSFLKESFARRIAAHFFNKGNVSRESFLVFDRHIFVW